MVNVLPEFILQALHGFGDVLLRADGQKRLGWFR